MQCVGSALATKAVFHNDAVTRAIQTHRLAVLNSMSGIFNTGQQRIVDGTTRGRCDWPLSWHEVSDPVLSAIRYHVTNSPEILFKSTPQHWPVTTGSVRGWRRSASGRRERDDRRVFHHPLHASQKSKPLSQRNQRALAWRP